MTGIIFLKKWEYKMQRNDKNLKPYSGKYDWGSVTENLSVRLSLRGYWNLETLNNFGFFQYEFDFQVEFMLFLQQV
jgi:hypothetical protein